MRHRICINRCLLRLRIAVILFTSAVVTYAGTPHTVSGLVTYDIGGSPSSATFSAYITSRTGEVLTQSSAGCSYGSGYYIIQCATFPTSWTAGDVLHINLYDGSGNSASGEVTLTNDPNNSLNLTIYTPDIDVSPSSHDYGSTEVGDDDTYGFTVSNTGGATLDVSSTNITGTDNGEFTVTGGGAPFILSPGANRTVNVQFHPSSGGSKSATLSISSNDLDENPVSISLSGTGITIPDISASPNPANFGSVAVGSYSDETIVVRSNGTEDLVVSGTTLTGGDEGLFSIQSGGGGFTLPPGETENIVIRFSPSSTGSKSTNLQISSNDPNENPYNITLNGSGVVPDIDVSPGSMDYGDVEITTGSTETFVVTNTGGATLSVSSTTLTGGDAGEFTITGGGGSFTLEPSQTHDVDVLFNPSSTGAKSTTLRFASNDPNEDPKDISLSGTGVTIPDISASPNPANYGSVPVGSYSEETIVVSNDGTENLVVDGTILTGGDAGQFSIQSGGGGFTLPPDETDNIIVRFSPSSTGSISASLQINSNDPNEDPYNVTLNGTGVVPDIDVSPGSMDYGDVEITTDSTETFVVSNTGEAILSVSSTTLTGGNVGEFTITGGGGSFTLTPGATHNVDVKFSPSATGVKSTTLRFISDDPDESTKEISLGGTGIAIPDIAVTPDTKNYGDVLIGFGSPQTFTVTNVGTGGLSVSSSAITGTHSSEYSIADGGGSFLLAQGSEHDITVSFNPDSAGIKNAVLIIVSNDPDEDTVEIALTGNGVYVPVPDIDVSPVMHDYGDVNIDTSIIQTFVVTNYGIIELSATLVSLTGTNSNEFSIINGAGNFTVDPGATHNIDIEFSPVSPGPKIAVLHIESDDPDENPHEVELTGNGIVIPDIDMTPDSMNFGDVWIGSSSPQTITVTSEGTGELIVISTDITGIDAGEFTITSGGGSFSLPPDSVHNIKVSFSPSSDSIKVATLQITSNDPDENLLNIPLTGNGIDVPAPDISIEPLSGDYGNVPVDSGVIVTFVISNTGTADLSVVSVILESEHDSDFNIVRGETAFILAPDSAEEIEIQFTPWTTGDRSATLTVTSDDPDENIINILLTGAGIITELESPYLRNCYPPPGALSIPVNAGLQFKITDDEEGIDTSTLNVYVNGDLIISGGIDQTGGDVDIISHDINYLIGYNPGNGLPVDDLINVQVQCNDLAPEEYSVDSTYSYNTASWEVLNLTSETIGSEGSTVYDDFTGIQIRIPDSALDEPTIITVDLVNNLPVLPKSATGIGHNYHFGPDGLVFNDSVIIGIPYTLNDLTLVGTSNPLKLPVFYYSVSFGSWIQLNVFDYDDAYLYTKVKEFCYLTLCKTEIITGIKDIASDQKLNRNHILHQNYPNPVVEYTTISFSIKDAGFVRLAVYDINFREIEVLMNEECKAGKYDVICNAENYPCGVYIYRLQTEKFSETRKMIIQ